MENKPFIGHSFIGDEEVIAITNRDSDSSEDVDDFPIVEPVDFEDAEVDEENPLPHKQKFSNLDEVCDQSKYDDLPAQHRASYSDANASKTFVMKYSTVKVHDDALFSKRGRTNILKNTPGPRRAAKHVETPLEAFGLFITDQMLQKIVTNTNLLVDSF